MYLRFAATAVAVASVLATGAGCSSSSPAPAKPSARPAATPSVPADVAARFLAFIHNSVNTQSDDLRLAAGHTPDAQVIAAGLEACVDLKGREASDAADLLAKQGWSDYDAELITFSAGGSLCRSTVGSSG